MISTYILTWNPNRFRWVDLREDIQRLRRNGYWEGNWSCGSTKRITDGDRVFLLRQGREPRGIVAAGFAMSGVYEGEHWEDPRVRALYLDVRFDVILDAERETILPLEHLQRCIPLRTQWQPQSSGQSLPAEAAARLEEVWKEFLAANHPSFLLGRGG